MPNIKSAKKRVKVIKAKTLRNQIIKSQLKTYIKKFELLVAAGDAQQAQSAFPTVIKKLDQATAKGIMHKNTASRKKSQLAVKLGAMA